MSDLIKAQRQVEKKRSKKGSRSCGGRPARICDIDGCSICQLPNCGSCKVKSYIIFFWKFIHSIMLFKL